MELTEAIDAAVSAADKAVASGMLTAKGEPAVTQLEELRRGLLAMRARGAVGADELRAMIRAVAAWAPEDDVSLLSALGVIARVAGGRRRPADR